jgi:hypothetical protein
VIDPLEVHIRVYFSFFASNLILSCTGIRVSLYNAVTEEQTDKLVAYMREFVEQEAAANTGPALLQVDEQS